MAAILAEDSKKADSDDELEDAFPNEVFVNIIQAKGLEVMDKNLFSRWVN